MLKPAGQKDGIGFRQISILPCLGLFGLELDPFPAVALRCFYQQRTDVTASCLGNAYAVLVPTAVVFARGKADVEKTDQKKAIGIILIITGVYALK